VRRTRILVCIPGTFVERYFPEETRAEILGFGEVEFRNDLRVQEDEEAFSALVREFKPEILITGWGSPCLHADTARATAELKYMCHVTGSVRANITREAMETGLLVTNWGPIGARPVAEGAMMMLLAGLRNCYAIQRRMHDEGAWPRDLAGQSLFGMKVGMHGLGYISQEQVKLMKPWSPEISAYSPHVPDDIFAPLGVTRATSLEQLYGENEAVCVHASKTQANFHIVNAEILSQMPDGALLVNTARGAVIDEQALAAELKTGRIRAALDVFEHEPLAENSPLRGFPNVLLFPHVAGVDSGRGGGIAEHAVANIRRYLSGEPVESVVPPQRSDLLT